MSTKTSLPKHSAEQQTDGDELLRKAAEALELPLVASIWADLVSHLGRTLNVHWAFVAKLLPAAETKLETLAAWHRGHAVRDLDYQLTVPFDDPLTLDVCVHACNARKHVQSAWLKRVKAEAFGQIKLVGSFGQTQGVLAIAHGQAFEHPDRIESMLRIYGSRAAVELERQLADERFYLQLLDRLRGSDVQQH